MACFKNALYVKGIFQYHVTHDVSVYALRRRNGEYTLTVLISWQAIKGRPV